MMKNILLFLPFLTSTMTTYGCNSRCMNLVIRRKHTLPSCIKLLLISYSWRIYIFFALMISIYLHQNNSLVLHVEGSNDFYSVLKKWCFFPGTVKVTITRRNQVQFWANRIGRITPLAMRVMISNGNRGWQLTLLFKETCILNMPY